MPGRGCRHVALGAALSVAALAVVLAAKAADAASSPPAPQPSTSPSPGPASVGAGNQVVLVGRVIVPRGDSVGEVVVFSGRVQIAGVARDDVVVASGPIVVSGQVSGSVVALDGTVTLASTAQVRGDVIARNDVVVAVGARVGGTIRERAVFTLRGPLELLGAFVTWLAVAVSTLLLALLMLLVSPRGIDALVAAAKTAPWASVAWGLALAIVVPLGSVLAIASVVGLPLGLWVLLALALLASVGYSSAVFVLGRAVVGTKRGRLGALLAGWSVAAVVGLIPYVSGVVWGLAAVYGIGALAVATWRSRGPRSARGSDRGGRHRPGAVHVEARTGGGRATGSGDAV